MADDYSGVKPLPGFACFAMGLCYFFMGIPLVLWTPNALIGWLWYRTLAKVPTSWPVRISVPVATLASAVGCCTFYPYRALIGAGFWVVSAIFAMLAVTPLREIESAPLR